MKIQIYEFEGVQRCTMNAVKNNKTIFLEWKGPVACEIMCCTQLVLMIFIIVITNNNIPCGRFARMRAVDAKQGFNE